MVVGDTPFVGWSCISNYSLFVGSIFSINLENIFLMTQLKGLIENSTQVSLYTICSGSYYDNQKGWSKIEATEELLEEVANLVIECVGGQSSTKEQIRRNIERFPNSLVRKNSWMTERIIFDIGQYADSIRCQYVAGQDYSAEIKEVRKHLKS